MRAGTGAESVKPGGNGSTRLNGLHSLDGRGDANGGSTKTQSPGTGTGGSVRGNDGRVAEKTWFAPVDSHTENESADAFSSDCPDGFCSVPWLTQEGPPVLQKDVVNHPSHYTDGGIECIDAIEAQLTPEEFRGYCKGNCAKYLWRERHKGGTESLKKAQWYLNRLIELDESQKG